MRVVVAGKGGEGKSVIAGTIARLAARQGARVLAMDFDLAPGLSISLGSGADPVEPPLRRSVEQRDGGELGWRDGIDPASAAMRFATEAPDGVRLLQRGKLGPDGLAAISWSSRAFCEVAKHIGDTPEFAGWTLIGDLPAGPRLIAEYWVPFARTYLVVVHPGSQSVLAARRCARLARALAPGATVAFVASRIEGEGDVRHVEQAIGERVLAAVPFDAEVAAAERLGMAPIDHAPDAPAITAIRGLFGALERGANA
jgi:CO dehydrogenase maturation factor